MSQPEITPLVGEEFHGQLTTLAHEMIEESRFSRLGADGDKLFFHVSNILTNPQSLAFGAFDNGVLCGMAIGVCGDVLPFSAAVVATEHYLFLRKPYRGGKTAYQLVRAFIAGALHRGARDVILSNGYGGDPDKVGKLFELCGCARIGGIYSLEN